MRVRSMSHHFSFPDAALPNGGRKRGTATRSLPRFKTPNDPSAPRTPKRSNNSTNCRNRRDEMAGEQDRTRRQNMPYDIRVNGVVRTVDVRRHAAALGVARRARHDRHEVRLRHGVMRRVHCASRQSRYSFLHHARRKRWRLRNYHDRGNWRDGSGRQDPEGMARPRGPTMRILPVGPDHVGCGTPGEQPASH